MKSGTKEVYLYEGVVPSGGKQIIKFNGQILCHRSVKGDKSDYLVHVETKAILRAYPLKTDRSKVLDDIAKNFDILIDFTENVGEFNLVTRPIAQKNKDNGSEVKYETIMTHFSDGTEVNPSCVSGCSSKKSFNVGEIVW